MKINWKWIGFVAGVTMALGVIFSSSIFRKYTLKLGADLGLVPAVSGIIQGVIFLVIFIGVCYLATSLYGKPYLLDLKKPDKKDLIGRGGGF